VRASERKREREREREREKAREKERETFFITNNFNIYFYSMEDYFENTSLIIVTIYVVCFLLKNLYFSA